MNSIHIEPRAGASTGRLEATRDVRIDVRNLDFYYGDLRALKDVSVPVYDRRVTAFIGPSGCGKSTLLRVFNRMYDLYPEQRATGEVIFDGQNILDRRQI